MASEAEVSGLPSRVSLTEILNREGIGPEHFKDLIHGLDPKQRALLMTFGKLVEFYANAYSVSLNLYEVALRENAKLREWKEARLPGEEGILLGDSPRSDDGSAR